MEHSNALQQSNEGLKIRKIVSSISPLTFIKLLSCADNKVNPRTATVNNITKSIYETLDRSPELFWFKSKGILLSTEECDILDRNRIRISLSNVDYEGVMDGGHNTFAIARFIVDKLYGKLFKKWDECKAFWADNYDDIVVRYMEQEALFNFSIPIEVITPSNEDGALDEFYDYISEICSARNNNIQLKETAKGNQVGFYDYLKEHLSDLSVIWKTGDKGEIKSEDVISLASLPLIFLQNSGLLPSDIKNLNKISIYSQKSKCVDYFNDVISNKEISIEDKGKYIITNDIVKSALELTMDIIEFFDRLYIEFPDLYHSASPGKFGRIGSVKKKKTSCPFKTRNDASEYLYSNGFFYPLLCGLTNLMEFNEDTQKVSWRINPNNLDLYTLDLNQYIALVKVLAYDPQKIGKGSVCYTEAENVFSKII